MELKYGTCKAIETFIVAAPKLAVNVPLGEPVA